MKFKTHVDASSVARTLVGNKVLPYNRTFYQGILNDYHRSFVSISNRNGIRNSVVNKYIIDTLPFSYHGTNKRHEFGHICCLNCFRSVMDHTAIRSITTSEKKNVHDTLEKFPMKKQPIKKKDLKSVSDPTDDDIADKLNASRQNLPKPVEIKIKENMNGRIREYKIEQDKKLTFKWKDLPTESSAFLKSTFAQKFIGWFRSMFLPIGYPDSVHSTYIKVHQWHFFENIVAGCIIVLCSQSMLESVGIGSAAATGAAVGIMWVLKDSIGEIGKMFFIQQFANSFDSHPKLWKLLGEFAFLLGSFLQLATIIAPSSQFLLLASSGYCLKSIHFAIWGAAHTTFTRAFALRGNVGDLVGKHESQYSMAQIVGSLLGVLFIYLSHAPSFLFGIFTILSPLHIYLTVSLLKATQFEILNTTSLPLLAREYVKSRKIATASMLHKHEKWFGEYIKPTEDIVNIRLGIPLKDTFNNGTSISSAMRVLKGERYLFYPESFANESNPQFLSPDLKKSYSKGSDVPPIKIVLQEQASHVDIIKAYLHASKLYADIKSNLELPENERKKIDELFKNSFNWVVNNFDEFMEGLEEMGWSTDVMYWNDKGYRVQWDTDISESQVEEALNANERKKSN